MDPDGPDAGRIGRSHRTALHVPAALDSDLHSEASCACLQLGEQGIEATGADAS